MATFDIILQNPGNKFNITFSSSEAPQPPLWQPPTINQIYPRYDFTTGSILYTFTGQLWPRGTGLAAPA